MDIQKEITEKVKLFDQVKNHLGEIAKKMGVLQEEQRAVYNQGLELKGAIDMLVALATKEREDQAKAAVSTLTLPDKSLVAADGKTVIVEAPKTVENAQEVAPAAVEPEKPVEAAPGVAPLLEVK